MSDNRIIHVRDTIASAPDRWKKQYDRYSDDGGKQKITEKLMALKARGNFTAQEVNEVIGNESWTTISCETCDLSKEKLIAMGYDTEWDCPTAYTCLECLELSAAALKDTTNGH